MPSTMLDFVALWQLQISLGHRTNPMSPTTRPDSIPQPTAGTPVEENFSMPPEWNPHLGTWLTWPKIGCESFQGREPQVYTTYRELVRLLIEFEEVFINVWDTEMEKQARDTLQLGADAKVSYFHHPSYEPWCRDHGPVFVSQHQSGEKAVIDWGYNAWGGKYPPFDKDNEVPSKIATLRNIKRFVPNMILEGGSIEVNGDGLLMTTESCLLNPNRNPNLSRSEIELKLQQYLGISRILWLQDGIIGDDTDGHIDDITRFVNQKTIVTAMEDNPDDPNFEPLQRNRILLERYQQENDPALTIIELPMPDPVFQEGLRLPASYANFYIANGLVVVPTFASPKDSTAIGILQNLMPDRKVVGLDSRALIWGLGSFHCITQQEPLGTPR